MLEKIMDLVKGQVMNTVDGNSEIPEDKKTETIETTTHSLIDGLKKYATPENLSSLTSMLGIGGQHQAAPLQTNGMASGLEANVVSALTSKVGLKPELAQTIASTVIPAVMSLFKKKVDDDNEPGFNIGSLVSTLTGGKSGNSASSGGVMDMLGGIFGNKD